MKRILYTLTGAMIFLGACSSDDGSRKLIEMPKDEAPPMTIDQPRDTVQTPPALTFTTYKDKKGDSKLEIEYPATGNQQLLDSIRTWINMSLGGTFRGNLDKGQALFNHYLGQLGRDPEMDDDEFEGSQQDEFKMIYQDSLIVTYRHKFYEYMGGAHGNGGDYGITFLKENGRSFSKDCFKSYKSLHQIFVNGLKGYFNAKSDPQLLDQLIEIPSVSDIPAPALDPWITSKGINFTYTSYEIAPYSAGIPHFTVPKEAILPYLNEEGKKFF